MTIAFTDKLLLQIRDRFAYADHDPHQGHGSRIFFENAGGSLVLRDALESMRRISGLPDNCGRRTKSSAVIGRVIAQGKSDAAIFLNAKAGVIMPGESTTANIVRIVEAVTASRKGTNIVCTNLDHPSLYDSTRFFAERCGLEWRVARLDPATGSVPPEEFARVVDAGTVLVGVIHASNVTGAKNDLASITACIRQRAPDTVILADGAQHAQHGVVDVSALDVDAYVFATYKVFTPPGVTFAYLGPRITEMPHARLLGKPKDDWELGTRNPAGYAAFTSSMDYLCWLGQQFQQDMQDRRDLIVAAMQAIEEHESFLMDRLLSGTEQCPGLLHLRNVTIHGSPKADNSREAVFAINVHHVSAGEFVERCLEANIVVHDRQCDAYTKHTLTALGIDQCVRVSLAHYNTPDEIDAFLRLTERIAKG